MSMEWIQRVVSLFQRASPTGVAASTGTIELVAAAIEYLRREVPDNSAGAALAARVGCSTAEADDALNFVPLAFGRVLLGRILPTAKFSDTYQLKTVATGGEYVTRHLVHSPLYQAALHAARATAARDDRESLLAIGGQSAEFNVMNQALHAGRTLEDLKEVTFGPPALWRP